MILVWLALRDYHRRMDVLTRQWSQQLALRRARAELRARVLRRPQ